MRLSRTVIRICSTLFLVSSLSVGCATTETITDSAANSTTKEQKKNISPIDSIPREPHGLGPGDVFKVTVFGQDELSGTHRIRTDHTIDFPLVGTIKMEAQDVRAIEETITGKLKDYLVNPQVSVFVTEYKSKKIFVFGFVKSPGTFAYQDGMNIIELISLAGGFLPNANQNGTYVTRTIKGNETKIDVAVQKIVEGRLTNLSLQPGDIVFIPESIF
ncbi:MAG: polysaccharide export protein [Deltaproteobacteria bacterium]|jgi:protein involved in polysaccharide export with SLBB domain|nr:polysaccharide export protein [Deltaproteobacteria bacterium]MBT6432939.1 polysaccharide export protein [Deltaproteobacteria bacterium]